MTLQRARERIAELTFATFSRVNRQRCESPDGFGHPLNGWTRSDWITAAIGEFGEAANKAKKLNRIRDGIPGNSETEEELRAGLADEIADTVIYLDLLAQSEGFDLGSIVASKFNRTSERIGAPHRLDEELADNLGAAWAAAEAALPEGWHNGPTLTVSLFGYDVQPSGRSYAALVDHQPAFRQRHIRIVGDGATPTAALRNLAAALRERRA